jgi:hypothetical protein
MSDLGNAIIGGNLGIGTTNPLNVVDIQKPGAQQIKIASTDTDGADLRVLADGSTQAVVGTVSNHPLQLYANNQAQMTISALGNVGIGTTSPEAKLHIVDGGQIKIGTKVIADAGGCFYA